MIEDGQTVRGGMTTVERIGDTIRRPTGPWTPTIHALLRHLEAVGFAGAPRILGIDSSDREILSFLSGTVAMRPWPDVLRADRGVIALSRWLRRYHEAVRSFRPPPNARWYVPDVTWHPGNIVRHGDLGPWNSVWDGDDLVGLFDWDFAEPGDPLTDVAQLAWYAVPLTTNARLNDIGFDKLPDLRDRLRILCMANATSPRQVVSRLVELQAEEQRRVVEWGPQGVEH